MQADHYCLFLGDFSAIFVVSEVRLGYVSTVGFGMVFRAEVGVFSGVRVLFGVVFVVWIVANLGKMRCFRE